jgi:hypothetical protein
MFRLSVLFEVLDFITSVLATRLSGHFSPFADALRQILTDSGKQKFKVKP